MHQQATATATMAFPSLPASPTLTNPDMILPYGEYDSTPSPPRHSESPTGVWKGIPGDMNFSIGPPGHLQLGIGPITSTTPIIYGNGTMLSDIGEVTEAESTPGRKPRPTQARLGKGRDSPLRSSPTIGYDTFIKRSKIGTHHRSVSEESNSTVRSEGQSADMFKDFDDGVSVDDSNFQGDDEESVAEEFYEDELEVAQAKILMRKESRLVDNDDMNSSAALSRRAEMILANAKKRLDSMEGNLTRARSSLYITPSSSMSSIHSSSPLSRSTPSPPDAERRIIAGLGVPPARHRQTNNPAVSPSSIPGHMRVFSENSIPSGLYSPQRTPRSPGAPSPSPVRADMEHKDFGPSAYPTPPSRNSNHFAIPLEPLSEDEGAADLDLERGNVRASTAEPYSIRPGDQRILTRSTSSMQMRDLTDKMKDLKGKISTLRDRAREDNMKRRSLQSLRTPSPFTAAEQWYMSSTAYNGNPTGDNAAIAHNPWNGEPSVTESVNGQDEKTGERHTDDTQKYEESAGPSIYQDAEEEDDENQEKSSPDHEAPFLDGDQDDDYDTAVEEGDMDDVTGDNAEDQYDDELVNHNEVEEYQSESDASLYHDSLAAPISHEDREDAFDYEHFFLHSAMGTISQQRLGRRDSLGSLNSFSSEDSVETTRGPGAPATAPAGEDVSDESARGHVRGQKSTDTISTMASFATATEGRRSSEVEDDDRFRDFTDESTTLLSPEDTTTTVTEKRSTFGKTTPTEIPESQKPLPSDTSRPSSVILDTTAQVNKLHHNSVSSFASMGTSRSFPLVNKPKNSASQRTSSILTEALRLNGSSGDSLNGRDVSPVDMLAREDQILVERLVASLGKSVLGLHEASRASTEGRMWRRRLDAARRVLEGQEGAM